MKNEDQLSWSHIQLFCHRGLTGCCYLCNLWKDREKEIQSGNSTFLAHSACFFWNGLDNSPGFFPEAPELADWKRSQKQIWNLFIVQCSRDIIKLIIIFCIRQCLWVWHSWKGRVLIGHRCSLSTTPPLFPLPRQHLQLGMSGHLTRDSRTCKEPHILTKMETTHGTCNFSKLKVKLEVNMKNTQLTFKQNRVSQVQLINSRI